MKREHKTEMLKIVKASGFPFQIALSNYIDKTVGSHGWRVLFEENPWQNKETGTSGYIDLILINRPDTEMMIIECKRHKDAKWIFLPKSDKFQRTYARCWISSLDGEKKNFGWYDVTLDPYSPEANYCVNRGIDKDRPMLERIAAELVDATESIALEELELTMLNKKDYFRRIYWPVIITNAKLQVCIFNTDKDIKLEDGEILEAEFKEVPIVRFTKSLTTKLPKNVIPSSFKNAVKEKRRTVFVINASKIVEVLKEWNLKTGPWSNW